MRLVFYSHDSYGLGHIRRTVSIAGQLLRDHAEASALVLTGAPRAHYLSYPARCDYIKLPSVTKEVDGAYVARELDLTLSETVGMRSRLIQSAFSAYPPDIFIVDHTPRGLCGEIVPVLEAGTRDRDHLRVLGLRDLIDEAPAVIDAWRRDDVLETMRRHYDRIFIYGQPDLYNPIEQYQIPADIAEKIVFTGYIPRNGARTAAEEILARYAPRTGQLVVVTAGGGGDGNLMVRAMLRGYASLGPMPPFELAVVTGQLMSPSKRQKLRDQAARLRGVTLSEFHDDLPALYRAAAFTVSMAGYNTVCELATAGCRSLLVPRCTPRAEQWERARLLAARGVVRALRAEQATPAALIQEVLAGLDRPKPPRRWGLDFGALGVISAQLADHLKNQPRAHRAEA